MTQTRRPAPAWAEPFIASLSRHGNARRAAREEGIFMGISSGASLAAVARKLPEMPAGSRVLTFCYDTGERYLSVEGLFV